MSVIENKEDHIAYQNELIGRYWDLYSQVGEVCTRLYTLQAEHASNILGETAAAELLQANCDFLGVSKALVATIDELHDRRTGHLKMHRPPVGSNICSDCYLYDYLTWH